MMTWFRRLLIPTFALALIFSAITTISAADKAPAKDAKKEEPKAGKDPKDMNADEAEDAGLCPICKKQAKPVYHFDFKDRDYHFASRDCQKKFAANPASFGAKGKEAVKK